MRDTPFEPSKYLTKLKGKDYLEVKFRLQWLRDEHPEAIIETELIEHTDNSALFKARVSIPNGGSATGYGSETARDFGDFTEKAETKAIGRALAALGYGTQFCEDHDFGADAKGGKEKVVDSPVERVATRATAPASSRPLASVIPLPVDKAQPTIVSADGSVRNVTTDESAPSTVNLPSGTTMTPQKKASVERANALYKSAQNAGMPEVPLPPDVRAPLDDFTVYVRALAQRLNEFQKAKAK